jgi:hypothetical protein
MRFSKLIQKLNTPRFWFKGAMLFAVLCGVFYALSQSVPTDLEITQLLELEVWLCGIETIGFMLVGVLIYPIRWLDPSH